MISRRSARYAWSIDEVVAQAFGARPAPLCRLAAMERVAFAALGEFSPGMGARRRGQPQERLGPLNIGDNQRFRDELEHIVDDLALRVAYIGRRRRGRIKRETGGKDRQAAQERIARGR